MGSDIKKIHLVGLAPSAIAVNLSLLRERHGDCEFHIYKNIEVAESPDLPINYDAFHIKIHPVGKFPEFNDHSSDLLLFGVPGPKAKEQVFNYFNQGKGFRQNDYYTFIHSGAYVAPEVELGAGVFIEPGVVISTQTTVDFGATIKRGALIGHHNKVGKYCEINPGVVLSGNVVVGEKAVIGTGVVVKHRVTIGANTMIGMGSNVVSDIPPNVVAYGNPCRVLKTNNPDQ